MPLKLNTLETDDPSKYRPEVKEDNVIRRLRALEGHLRWNWMEGTSVVYLQRWSKDLDENKRQAFEAFMDDLQALQLKGIELRHSLTTKPEEEPTETVDTL